LILFFLLFNFLFGDKVILKERNQLNLKNYLGSLSGDNPNGVGGYYIPEQKQTPVSYMTYIISRGDTLHGISNKLGIDVVTILNFNDINIPSRIIDGKKIIIPNQDGISVTLDSKNSLKKISNKYKVDIDDLKTVNYLDGENNSEVVELFVPGLHVDSITRSLLLGEFFVKPISGGFSSHFGFRIDPWTNVRSFHSGLDIRSPFGSKVYSSGFGQVIFVGFEWPLGNMIEIRHPAGYTTVYGHLDKIVVKKNQWVKTGEYIGKVGMTGRTTGPHLHYEVHKNGNLINPLTVTLF